MGALPNELHRSTCHAGLKGCENRWDAELPCFHKTAERGQRSARWTQPFQHGNPSCLPL